VVQLRLYNRIYLRRKGGSLTSRTGRTQIQIQIQIQIKLGKGNNTYNYALWFKGKVEEEYTNKKFSFIGTIHPSGPKDWSKAKNGGQSY
jgi:hypothetical protein